MVLESTSQVMALDNDRKRIARTKLVLLKLPYFHELTVYTFDGLEGTQGFYSRGVLG